MHFSLFQSYNKSMDNNVENNQKRRLVTVLTVIMFICLAAAGVLSVKEYLSRRHSESLIDNMRINAKSAITSDNTASNDAIASNGGTIPRDAIASNETTASREVKSISGCLEKILQKGRNALSNFYEAEEPVSPPKLVPNPYEDSFLANEDMAAWLVIPGTNVDYPVMWTPRDEEYYLRRGFDGKADNNGCLILDTDSCLNPLTTNLIIHGHNMRSGAMFGKLLNYEKEDFYREHRQMILYTEECQRNYEIIAVFRSQVYRKSDKVFKFYKFFQADTQEEFDDFYQNIMSLSQYDTGVTAEFGDHFLTLSTCAYHVEEGRFVVVAKEVETGDYYEPIRRENDHTINEEEHS